MRVYLYQPQQAHQVMVRLWPQIKARLMAGHRLTLTVEPQRRSNDQNAMLHAVIGEIAGAREWCGRRWEPEVWKRLLVAAWTRAKGESVTVLPALDGHGVDMVPVRTSALTRAECAELIDFIQAWAADQGLELETVDAATGEIRRAA